jgi:nitroreductase
MIQLKVKGLAMDINKAMMTRRTIHYWQPLPMSEEAIQKSLGAAHMAQCHKFTWPWRFTRVGPQARKALFDLTVDIKKGNHDKLPDRMMKTLIRKIQNPAALIVVSMTRCEDAFMERENYAAVSCAIQNLALSLHASGYGSKWSTGKVIRHPQSYIILNIDPAEEEIVGFIWAGVPERIPDAPQRSDLGLHIRSVD